MASTMIPQTYNATYICFIAYNGMPKTIQSVVNIILQCSTVAVKKINSHGYKVDKNIHYGQQKQFLLLLTIINIFVAK